MMGSRGLYADGWKATTNYVANSFDERSHIEGSHDFDDDHWALFDLANDFSEAHDLSAQHPDKVRALKELWWAEAGRNQVLPLFEFPASLAAMQPGEYAPPARAVYEPGGRPIIVSQLPAMVGGFSLRADIAVADDARRCEGVVCALGDRHGGWGLYVVGGVATAVFHIAGASTRLAASSPLDAGAHTIGVRYSPRAEGANVVLSIDGVDVDAQPLVGLFFFPGLTTAGTGMLVGRDRGLPLDDDYEPPFPFTATLHRVEMSSGVPSARPDPATEVVAAVRSD
jgi:arylsulfatase